MASRTREDLGLIWRAFRRSFREGWESGRAADFTALASRLIPRSIMVNIMEGVRTDGAHTNVYQGVIADLHRQVFEARALAGVWRERGWGWGRGEGKNDRQYLFPWESGLPSVDEDQAEADRDPNWEIIFDPEDALSGDDQDEDEDEDEDDDDEGDDGEERALYLVGGDEDPAHLPWIIRGWTPSGWVYLDARYADYEDAREHLDQLLRSTHRQERRRIKGIALDIAREQEDNAKDIRTKYSFMSAEARARSLAAALFQDLALSLFTEERAEALDHLVELGRRAMDGDLEQDADETVSERLTREITYCMQPTTLGCDGRCDKAWGRNARPFVQVGASVDDFAYLADDELGTAPSDSPILEGGHGKPDADHKLESKWCARECERSAMVDRGQELVFPDLTRRLYNRRPHVRE